MKDHLGNELEAFDAAGNPLLFTVEEESPGARSPLTDPLTPFGVQPVGQSGLGDPVFSDEFLAGELSEKWLPWYPDTDFWNTTTPGGHKSNTSEPQAYDPSGITFDEDGMILTMRNESTIEGLAYTSGMVCSYPSFNPVYGYFEARMQFTDTRGAWPAFWMMPQDQSWPPEIDIVENWGRESFNTETRHTFHDVFPGDASTTAPYSWAGQSLEDWHTYGCLWEPGRIRWYCDGNLALDLEHVNVPSKNMYLICNLAGEKTWEDNTPQPEDLPFSIRVNYVRAWALNG